MGGYQMILILLVTILFSTLIITSYDTLFDQTQFAYYETYNLQGIKVADKQFQKIESEFLGDIYSFSDLNSAYSDYSDSLTVNDVTYNYHIEASYCDSSGHTVGGSSSYQRFDVRIWAKPATSDTVYIGTSANPLSMMLTDMGL